MLRGEAILKRKTRPARGFAASIEAALRLYL
jgi:hypothetical protein